MFRRRQFLWTTAVALAAATASACSGDSNDSPTQPTEPLPQGPATLQTTDLTVGEGTEATSGKTVFVAYALWRFDPAGTDQKGLAIQPGTTSYIVGGTGVIAGVSQGTIGMKVGGKRRLVIPPSLGYGTTGTTQGEVRPNEWIVFEIDLLAVA